MYSSMLHRVHSVEIHSVFREADRVALLRPLAGGSRVVVVRDRVQVPLDHGRENLRPAGAVVIAATRDDHRALAARRLHVGGVLAEQVGVELRRHVAAAAPGLVADAEVVHVPGLVPSIATRRFLKREPAEDEGAVVHPRGECATSTLRLRDAAIWKCHRAGREPHEGTCGDRHPPQTACVPEHPGQSTGRVRRSRTASAAGHRPQSRPPVASTREHRYSASSAADGLPGASPPRVVLA